MTDGHVTKALVWVGSSRKDFSAFPEEVMSDMGYALFMRKAVEGTARRKPSRALAMQVLLRSLTIIVAIHFALFTRALRIGGLCVACLPEEIETGHCNP